MPADNDGETELTVSALKPWTTYEFYVQTVCLGDRLAASTVSKGSAFPRSDTITATVSLSCRRLTFLYCYIFSSISSVCSSPISVFFFFSVHKDAGGGTCRSAAKFRAQAHRA